MIIYRNLIIFTIVTSIIFAMIPSIVSGVSVISPELTDELIRNKHMINGTLTQEQVNEVEKNPSVFMATCYSRIIDGNMDPGKICDSAFKYLYDKCERLDNLRDYCLSYDKGGITPYMIDRLDQLLNLHSQQKFLNAYKNWEIFRDKPECNTNLQSFMDCITQEHRDQAKLKFEECIEKGGSSMTC